MRFQARVIASPERIPTATDIECRDWISLLDQGWIDAGSARLTSCMC